MGNISSHTASVSAGTALGGAIIGILVTQFHMDPGLATNWLIVLTAIVGGPVMAYIAVKAKGDPALAAALDAITAISQQQGNGSGSVPATTATVTATTALPAAATVTSSIGSGNAGPTAPASAPAVVGSPPQPAALPPGAPA